MCENVVVLNFTLACFLGSLGHEIIASIYLTLNVAVSCRSLSECL
jgi:hypothetical protein